MIMFKELSWITLNDRFKYLIGIQVYKAINNNAPSYYCNIIKRSSDKNYNLRSITNNNLCCERPNSSYFKRTFGYTGMAIWNKIPLAIRNKPSFNQFKHSFYTYLLVASNTSS